MLCNYEKSKRGKYAKADRFLVRKKKKPSPTPSKKMENFSFLVDFKRIPQIYLGRERERDSTRPNILLKLKLYVVGLNNLQFSPPRFPLPTPLNDFIIVER